MEDKLVYFGIVVGTRTTSALTVGEINYSDCARAVAVSVSKAAKKRLGYMMGDGVMESSYFAL